MVPVRTTSETHRRQPAKSKQRPSYARRIRPPYTYTQLISQAICASSERALTLRQIVTCLENRYSCFRGSYRGWRNSIRHNLSASECFRKILRDESKPNGKDNYWTMNEHCKHCQEKSTAVDDVIVSRKVNRKQKRDCEVPGPEINNNDNMATDTNTAMTFPIQKVEDTEAQDGLGLVTLKPTDQSQAECDRIFCSESVHGTTSVEGQRETSDEVAWQEMEGFNIEKFAYYNSCYEYSYDNNASSQQMYDTETQQQPRTYVQSSQRPYPVHLTTSQGYPVAHDMYRNGYCAPPYNMVDQSMFFNNSNSNQQQQYVKMNNGSFYGPGSQVAQQMQLVNGRTYQEPQYYQQL